MRHFRKTLLTILVLATVVASLVGYPGATSALPSRGARDPVTPTVSPPGVLDPDTGEPDTGSTRHLTANGNRQAVKAQSAARALSMIRWTSFVWAKRILGIGE